MSESESSPSWTTGEIASMLEAELCGSPDISLNRIDAISAADARTLTFVRDAARLQEWLNSPATAALVSRAVIDELDGPPDIEGSRALIVVDNADHSLIALLARIATPNVAPQGIDPSASVHPSAHLGKSVRIGPCAVIGPDCRIGDNAVIHAGVVIGAGVRIGSGTVLHPNVTILDRCSLGAHVEIHSGATIGADGFGYVAAPDGSGPVKIPHIGTVEIHDHVEIGANTTIDRAKFGMTVIGAGTKIDNLVQIGHNCRIGRGCIICGCCGISGSVTIGDGVTLAGGVAIADNMTIGNGATIGARSGLMNDVPPGETWVGYPARPARQTMRTVAAVEQLPDLMKQFRPILRAFQQQQGEQA